MISWRAISSACCTSGFLAMPARFASCAMTSLLISTSRTRARNSTESCAPRAACCLITNSARVRGIATPFTVATGPSPVAGGAVAAGLAGGLAGSFVGNCACASASAGIAAAAIAARRLLFISFLSCFSGSRFVSRPARALRFRARGSGDSSDRGAHRRPSDAAPPYFFLKKPARRSPAASACCPPGRRPHGRHAARCCRSARAPAARAPRAGCGSRPRRSLLLALVLGVARDEHCLSDNEQQHQPRAAEQLEVHPCVGREAERDKQIRGAHEGEEADPAPVQLRPDRIGQRDL